jgi:hypothetical protein
LENKDDNMIVDISQDLSFDSLNNEV